MKSHNCVHTHTHRHTQTNTHTHTHRHTHTHTQTHTHKHTHADIHIHIGGIEHSHCYKETHAKYCRLNLSLWPAKVSGGRATWYNKWHCPLATQQRGVAH